MPKKKKKKKKRKSHKQMSINKYKIHTNIFTKKKKEIASNCIFKQ